jgi:carboxypeptidase Q
MRKHILSSLSLLLFLPFGLAGQYGSVDLEMVYKIKSEGMKNSGIDELAFWMTDYLGPRLAGSKAGDRANNWVKNKMEEFSLQNVRIESARNFDRGGWDNKKTYAAMTGPYYANFAANPVAWTGSTRGTIKSNVILLDIKNDSDFEKYKGKLNGKIVLMSSSAVYEPVFTPLATRFTDQELKDLEIIVFPPQAVTVVPDQTQVLRTKINEFIKEENVAVILNNSGTFNVPRSTFGTYKSGDPEPVPQLNLPIEAAGRMERLLRHNIPVEMEVEIQNTFVNNPTINNVIGEIPGTDPKLKDEIVLLGAHIDSYQGGTGAADNASGCIVMMEAMRILKTLGISPKRTIRIALWGGEEEGYYGSRGYIDKYLVDPDTKENKPGYNKFAGYFNMDNGTGKFRGIYLQGNDMVRPIFEEWIKPFSDMGFNTLAIRNTTGTDHTTFDAINLPGFQFIQDRIEYSRGYHTVMDTYERLIMNDLRQNAIIVASMVYNASMRDQKLPAKPVMNSK